MSLATIDKLTYLFYLLGYIVALIISILLRQKYRTSRLRVVLYSFTIAYGFLCAKLGGIILTQINLARGHGGGSASSIFGAVVFTPVLEILTVEIERGIRALLRKRKKQIPVVSVRDTLDMLTPSIFMILIFGKFKCACVGCCCGYPCSWGIVSHFTGERMFPVQLFEAATTLLILLVCFKIKESSFFRRGMAYPLTAAMYSAARFGWEFARYYLPEGRNYFGVITFWQCACILVFVCSVISIVWLYKTKPSEPLPKIGKKQPKYQ